MERAWYPLPYSWPITLGEICEGLAYATQKGTILDPTELSTIEANIHSLKIAIKNHQNNVMAKK